MSERTTPADRPTDVSQDEVNPWPGLVVCLVAGAMTLLDVSIVNVALPSIRSGLDAGDNAIQWVVAGYALAFGVVLVPAGRLGDARSRKNVFMAGVALFTVSSAMCGLAPNPVWLGVARVVQGVGGGLITPQVSGFIQNLFKGEARAKAFGLFGATIGISTAIGPLLGGLLIQLGGDTNGWRLVFYVNVPIGIILLGMAAKLLPHAAEGRKQSLDPVGTLLFTAAMFVVLLPVVTGKEGTPLRDRQWWLLGVSAAILLVFVLWERLWTRRGKEGLLDLTLFRVRSYVLGLLLGTFYFAGFTSIFIVLTLYLQTGLHYSALQAGGTQMSFAIGAAVSAFLGGKVVNRLGRSVVVLGLVLVSGGLIGLDRLVPHLHGDVGLKLAPLLLISGIGGGLVISPNITLTLAEVDPVKAGAGGGLLQTTQRVGSAIGVAIVLAQFFERVASTQGDYGDALSYAFRTTIGLVLVALVFSVVDLFRRAGSGGGSGTHHAGDHVVVGGHARGGAHLPGGDHRGGVGEVDDSSPRHAAGQ